MLPLFSNLKKSYPGNANYGGLYSDQDIIKMLNLSSHSSINGNDTCILRMSAALNLNTGHEVKESYNGSAKAGSKGLYYFYDRNAFGNYLKEMYGQPLSSNTTEKFSSQVGIMFINVNERIESSDVCDVLLWNGMGFHQGRGFLHHFSVTHFELWPTTTGMLVILELLLALQ